jgi:hypothetical protein
MVIEHPQKKEERRPKMARRKGVVAVFRATSGPGAAPPRDAAAKCPSAATPAR